MTDIIQHYVQQYHHLVEQGEGAKNWLQPQCEAAMRAFEQQGFPSLRNEAWKYTKLTSFTKRAFVPSLKPALMPASQLTNLRIPKLDTHVCVFVDGVFQSELSSITNLPQQAIVCDLKTALQQHQGKLASYLNHAAKQIPHAFAKLNTAFLHDGIFIYAPKNCVLSKPIQLMFVASQKTNLNYINLRNIIVAAEGSNVTVLENYVGPSDTDYFTNAINEIFVEENAVVEHIKLQQEGQQAYHIATTQINQASHSQFNGHAFMLGAKLARSDVNVALQGQGANCDLNGLYLPKDKQHIDQHTLIDHRKAHNTSREFYRGILRNKSRAIFDGQIYVHEGAVKSDANLVNKNLLLSEQAEIDTKPQLEIYNDDVKCSHGATVGKLDQDALFYLQARGLDRATAANILTYAFAREAIERLPESAIVKYLEEKVRQNLFVTSG